MKKYISIGYDYNKGSVFTTITGLDGDEMRKALAGIHYQWLEEVKKLNADDEQFVIDATHAQNDALEITGVDLLKKGAQLNKTLNQIACEHWRWVESVDWHNKTELESLGLITSEIGIAMNLHRDNIGYGHKLADAILRIVDLAESLGFDIEALITQRMNRNRNMGRVNNRDM